jgi:UDP-hydrolysing UDP-N-acetyl-D-glucosamine 2-epimerase
MKRIGVVTGARADYGIFLPLLHRLRECNEIQFQLFVTGMHLSERHGYTVEQIIKDGFPIAARIATITDRDQPFDIAYAMGRGTSGFAEALGRYPIDLLIILGDRFEMHSAAVAALPYKIAVAHIHGGEVSEGAFDDALRHSMTKLSHLHFVAAEDYANRVRQLGEEPWRVTICGALSLENLKQMKLLSKAEIETRIEMALHSAPILVTFHPVTLEHEQTAWQIEQLLTALESVDAPIIFTPPNADTGREIILQKIQTFLEKHATARMLDLGTQAYFSCMKIASMMVGNSSSGILEAPSFRLPVVNVGSRQRGRLRSPNILDVDYRTESILEGIRKAGSTEFQQEIANMQSPFEHGNPAEMIVSRILEVPLDDRLLIKRFHDLPRRENT